VTSNAPIKLFSVVIPARDEEGCIASTVEHLHLELELRGVPHEIIVVDDGSTDRTWQILQEEATRLNVPSNPPTFLPSAACSVCTTYNLTLSLCLTTHTLIFSSAGVTANGRTQHLGRHSHPGTGRCPVAVDLSHLSLLLLLATYAQFTL
jgi:cellulose synthase/poly-beta-1,6-N-acetylglucosamine synthase-like glycosyltransferase